uniref:Uncharacterized protein n=1 Tax=Pseudictyota dubia TaxID=2749911 RepID=A0A7R9W123_9STRA|mmetsp:Transcript_27412/g.50919  ORF Transcript_27412/g.50919 Transcript_27412/m.50919 type:complete len:201 (+) Transcript_27412:144-746(+)
MTLLPFRARRITMSPSLLSSSSVFLFFRTCNDSFLSRPLDGKTTGRLSRSQLSQESLAGTKRKRTRRRVSLKADVAVVPIPRREEYSDRIKERLWSSAAELYRNAARNAVEFASEGWNWRNVTEDEDMLVHSVSGELVHPVHLQNVLQMNAEAEAGGSGEPLLPIPLRPNRPVGAAASSTAAASASEQSQSQSQTSSAPA